MMPQAGTPRSSKAGYYDVNVIVDNSEMDGAPVIRENSPNYKNLFGTIHAEVDRTGKVLSGFRHISAGSMLRANGGYLVFDLMEALMEPLVWKELKRSLKSGILEYHMYDPFGVFATSALKPEPIPLNIRLVVTGNPLVYHLLHLYDEDFDEIFKVKAEFTTDLKRDVKTEAAIAHFIRMLKDGEDIVPFNSGAVNEVVRASIRMAENRNKITAEFRRIADIIRESSYWARKENVSSVDTAHVRKAVDEKVYRSDLIAEKIRELIAEGTLLIDTDGEKVGQVNGLSVIQLGDYSFGRPVRLTASIGVGSGGIVNIERESRLSGKTYDKAMMILEGYLRNKYAGGHPMSFSASITMEQSYGMIEGDSATISELVCLLSGFAHLPLRQDIALTGSVNQWGEVQAVGGVTEKVEGFFDICTQSGRTGRQGVCLPASNKKNLILRPDVIEAIQHGSFHIWAVKNVDEVIELLSGVPAGDVTQEDSVHYRVEQRLKEIADLLKKGTPGHINREIVETQSSPPSPPRQPDPRPPFPGQNV
jgi:lon-related putative ATP-dependent protease